MHKQFMLTNYDANADEDDGSCSKCKPLADGKYNIKIKDKYCWMDTSGVFNCDQPNPVGDSSGDYFNVSIDPNSDSNYQFSYNYMNGGSSNCGYDKDRKKFTCDSSGDLSNLQLAKSNDNIEMRRTVLPTYPCNVENDTSVTCVLKHLFEPGQFSFEPVQ